MNVRFKPFIWKYFEFKNNWIDSMI
jgi:hypothetical protein